jgi:DNA-binding MarR family transcriptional regulator
MNPVVNSSALLDSMEEKGWVKKSRSRPNSRTVTVSVTKAGLQLLDQISPKAERYHDLLTARISKKDLAIARRVLSQLYNNASDLKGHPESLKKAIGA